MKTSEEDTKRTSFLHIRVEPADKGAWVRAANARQMKLEDWAIEALRTACESEQRNP